jgi:hypothetical protein
MCKRKGPNLRTQARVFTYIGLILIGLCIPYKGMVFGQANQANSGDVTCPAVGGAASIEVIPARSGRYSYSLNNVSGVMVRIGYLDGTDTSALTTANSWQLQPGQPYSDSAPGLLSKRVVCMSSGAAAIISFNETYR